jgi:O-antigen ligase
MRLARALNDVEARKVQSFVLFGGVFTTLAIWTKLEDPINLPKMFVLVLFAAVVLGLSLPVFLNIKKTSSGSQRIALILIGIFALGLLISTAATDVKYTAIFGEYHRNNGALSYISMALLMVVAALVFDLKSSGKYLKFYAATALILTLYGFMQGAGKDPVGWVIDYNPFITTLGNPNFTSGFLGIAAIAIYLLAIEAKDRKVQVAWLIGLLADLYILRKSGSIQGLFGFLIGAAIITIVKLWLVKKRYGQVALVTTGILGIPVALAVLNIGPLASKLYQGTLRNRLDYWQAAFNMFKEQPIFGIGIDRFGEYYRENAVQVQVVQGQTTDNAHSIYMQLLATGGLALFIPYIVLIVYITYIGLRALIRAEGAEKLRISGIFGIWLGSVSVNIVAIDNLGVAVWFWITGGVLIALTRANAIDESSTNNQKNVKSGKANRNNSTIAFPWPVLSAAIFLCLALIFVSPGISKSHNSFILKNNSNNLSASAFVAELNRQVSGSQNNIHNLIVLNDIALRQGEIDLSLRMSERIREIDPRSFYGQYLPAIAYEATSNPAKASIFREKLVELDPWNTANMLQLIKNYLAIGDRAKAAATAALIKQIYPGSQSDIDAAALLVG